jgi:hypothetical protein
MAVLRPSITLKNGIEKLDGFLLADGGYSVRHPRRLGVGGGCGCFPLYQPRRTLGFG